KAEPVPFINLAVPGRPPEEAPWWRSAEVRGHAGPATALAFSPDGHTLAVGHLAHPRKPAAVRVWRVPRDAVPYLRTFEIPEGARSLDCSADGKQFLACALDGSVHRWDVATGEKLLGIGANKVQVAAAFLPGGRIVIGLTEGAVIWDPESGDMKSLRNDP